MGCQNSHKTIKQEPHTHNKNKRNKKRGSISVKTKEEEKKKRKKKEKRLDKTEGGKLGEMANNMRKQLVRMVS